jgi:glyoxylate reductase
MKKTILVSMPVPGKAIGWLEETGCEVVVLPERRPRQEFETQFQRAYAAMTLLSDPIPAELIAAAPQLKLIANYAVGYNNIDLAECRKRKILVTNTPDVLTDATADIALLLLLGTMRRAIPAADYLKAGSFDGWKPNLLMGRDLRGKNLGIIGMGRIGLAVARRAEAFGMKPFYFSQSGRKPELPYPAVSFETILRESDAISLHVPLTPATRHLIGEKELLMMKPDAVLINTARGPVVDENALVRVLKKGHLLGVGMDVFEEEPKVHPGLWECPNAFLVPHIGSATIETRSQMAELAAKSILAVLVNQRPVHLVNPEVL